MLANKRFKFVLGNIAFYRFFPVHKNAWSYWKAGSVIFIRMVVIKRFGYGLNFDIIFFTQTGHHRNEMFSRPAKGLVEIKDYFQFFAFDHFCLLTLDKSLYFFLV